MSALRPRAAQKATGFEVRLKTKWIRKNVFFFCLSPFGGVTLLSRYTVINRCDSVLLVKQYGSNISMALAPGETRPLHWADGRQALLDKDQPLFGIVRFLLFIGGSQIIYLFAPGVPAAEVLVPFVVAMVTYSAVCRTDRRQGWFGKP